MASMSKPSAEWALRTPVVTGTCDSVAESASGSSTKEPNVMTVVSGIGGFAAFLSAFIGYLLKGY